MDNTIITIMMTQIQRFHLFRAILPAIAIILLATSSSNAQPEEMWRIGGFVGWGPLDYTAKLHGLPGVPSCCPEYTDGSGSDYTLGISWGLPLFYWLGWEGRISFIRHNGTLDAKEYELVTAGHDTVTATFGHSIEVWQPALGIDALFSVSPLSNFKIVGGMRGEFMLGGTFHQQEVILSPDNIRFENDQRQRLVYDDDIPDEARTHFSLVGGIRYEISLNNQRSVVLAPEVLLWQDFIDLVENERWKVRGFRFGLSLQFIHGKGESDPSPLNPISAREAKKRREQKQKAELEQDRSH